MNLNSAHTTNSFYCLLTPRDTTYLKADKIQFALSSKSSARVGTRSSHYSGVGVIIAAVAFLFWRCGFYPFCQSRSLSASSVLSISPTAQSRQKSGNRASGCDCTVLHSFYRRTQGLLLNFVLSNPRERVRRQANGGLWRGWRGERGKGDKKSRGNGCASGVLNLH